MTDWQVSLDYPTKLDIDALAQIEAGLEDRDAAIGMSDGNVSATITIEDVPNVIEAISTADLLVREAADEYGYGNLGDPVEAHANTGERAEAELEQPTLPDLVSSVEAADILGVSRQRVGELRRRDDFPEPMYELRTGPLWVKGGIMRFGEQWSRTPGRPRQKVGC